MLLHKIKPNTLKKEKYSSISFLAQQNILFNIIITIIIIDTNTVTHTKYKL